MGEIDKTGALGREMKEQEDKLLQAEAEGVDEVSSTTLEKTGYIEFKIKIGSDSEIEEEIKKNSGILNFLIENSYELLGVDNKRVIIKVVKEEIKDKKNVKTLADAYRSNITIISELETKKLSILDYINQNDSNINN